MTELAIEYTFQENTIFVKKCHFMLYMYLNLVEKGNYRAAFYFMFLQRRELSEIEKSEYPLWDTYVKNKRVCSICLNIPKLAYIQF